MTDAALIQRSLTDPSVFAEVFDRHFESVFRFLARRVGVVTAGDLASETFARAFEGRRRYRLERDDARPWLFGIATNLLRRHRRNEVRQLRAYARTGVDPVLDGLDDADSRADAAAAGSAFADALASLRADERDVLFLYAWADLSYVEIAEALGLPVGTVRSRLSRARAKVRELMAADGQELVEVPRTRDVTDG
jgi:RNA polymerase sigma-70 factor, ECF subfamily